jgi:hypothetical protein
VLCFFYVLCYVSRPLIHLFLQMLKYVLPYKCNCIMISNTFNFLLTLKNRPIRWRTLYVRVQTQACLFSSFTLITRLIIFVYCIAVIYGVLYCRLGHTHTYTHTHTHTHMYIIRKERTVDIIGTPTPSVNPFIRGST